MSLKPYIETLIAGDRHLTADETFDAFSVILKENPSQCQVASLLTLLRLRRENPQEIAGMVRAMNAACKSVKFSSERKLLDIVGTGGDGADTINISTASVVLAAACGATVAKAGNRSVSSACGSADVLEALGIKVALSPEEVVTCVERCGIAFLFAPINHPAMKAVAPIRKQLGVRTCFNILGPMTNAASAQRAVIGVFHEELLELMAETLKEVGRVDHAVVIHGVGLDEISPMGPATIVEIKNTAPPGKKKTYTTRTFEFDPLTVNIPRCKVEDLRGGDPAQNAKEFEMVLQGGEWETNAKKDAIVLNAGVGCYVYGLTETIEEGCALAKKTLIAGKGEELLKRWKKVSNTLDQPEAPTPAPTVSSTPDIEPPKPAAKSSPSSAESKMSTRDILLSRVLILLALCVGWLNRGPTWEARFFATLIPVAKGYLPPTLVGHGWMRGTPPVPDDMHPEPRPKGELFLKLPGGARMPQNGLGMCCRPTAYDDVLVERSVLWYLLMGGRHIDGAHLYLNHEAIGKGIRQAMERGVPRSEIFLTTKIWPNFYGRNSTKEVVPTFLKELGVDYIDMILMHAPAPIGSFNGLSKECNKAGLSNTECRQETFAALSELRKEGLVRNVGVSNFITRQIKELQEIKGAAPIANNQIQFNPWLSDEWMETAEYCRESKIAITGYNSLGGFLEHKKTHTIEVLTTLAEKYQKTVAQIMLRWALQKGTTVIPGTGNPKYMRENLSIYGFKLSKEDVQAIDELRTAEEMKKFTILESKLWEK